MSEKKCTSSQRSVLRCSAWKLALALCCVTSVRNAAASGRQLRAKLHDEHKSDEPYRDMQPEYDECCEARA